jgi:hypothetical protein
MVGFGTLTIIFPGNQRTFRFWHGWCISSVDICFSIDGVCQCPFALLSFWPPQPPCCSLRPRPRQAAAGGDTGIIRDAAMMAGPARPAAALPHPHRAGAAALAARLLLPLPAPARHLPRARAAAGLRVDQAGAPPYPSLRISRCLPLASSACWSAATPAASAPCVRPVRIKFEGGPKIFQLTGPGGMSQLRI